MEKNWKLLSRKKIYSTDFASLYSDKIKLPNGHEIDDYSVVSFPDGVVIVATDEKDRLITIHEYKYAINKTILNLPSGTAEPGLDILALAKKELLEETGYLSDDLEVIREMYEYPSKLTHSLFVVRAKNAHKVANPSHEQAEQIGDVYLLSKGKDYDGEFNTTYNLAALAVAAPEFIK